MIDYTLLKLSNLIRSTERMRRSEYMRKRFMAIAVK